MVGIKFPSCDPKERSNDTNDTACHNPDAG